METIPQNPIIKAAAEHINKGENVLQIFDDETDTSVTIRLDNGAVATDVQHPIPATDHREFIKWFIEASNWMARRHREEQARVGS